MRSVIFLIDEAAMAIKCPKKALAAILSVVVLADLSPKAWGQQDFSWFGNQIIENSTQLIPAGQSYTFYFQVMEPAVARIDVSSGQGLSVFLLTKGANDASERNGTLSNWIKREKGSSISFVSRVLSPDQYVLRVENYLKSAQRASVRVWMQKYEP